MSHPTIYQRDIEAYGRFSASQIQRLVVPVDAGFKQALRAITARLDAATKALLEAKRKAVAAAVATPAPRASRRGRPDPVAAARDLMRRLVELAASRPGGVALAREILKGQTLATVLRGRPAKLADALAHALEVIEQHGRRLPDHDAWAAELQRSREAIEPLLRSVRKTRLARRTMTPEVKAARDEWLNTYAAAKLLVEGVLRLHGKASLMPEIFDDLAPATRASRSTAPAPGAPADAPAPS
ncbi:hypothetical protein [Sorangium sp. So ce1024]|uniref:hypothetical protein n=1 Tax=Sorangium sp. So ce1024 TaxID=3133327 RepID=UPI003F10FF89